MEDFDVPKIARELSSDANVVREWRKFYEDLKLPPAEAERLNTSFRTETITNYELILKILERWQSANGVEASAQNLETILRNLELVNAAGIPKIENPKS